MWRCSICLVAVLVGCGPRNASSSPELEPIAGLASIPAQRPKPLKPYRMGEIPSGFRGDAHPALVSKTPIELSAVWSPVPTGRALDLGYFPLPFYEPFQKLQLADAQREYSPQQFSVFLPSAADFGSVGDMWAVDLDGIAKFLRQFHLSASMHLDAAGRRAGPDGGFAILKAKSPLYAEIAFRVHAEFDLEPGVYYTPAYFSGRLVVNRQDGAIVEFYLGIPTDKSLNVTLTYTQPTEALLDIVNVSKMELVKAATKSETDRLGKVQWTEKLEHAECRDKLRRAFYRFAEIDWVPPEQAVALAQRKGKPILAIVLWGGLDDQSC